ncbi:MAG: helix-turn-helix transcriptional regulator [Acinetobacter johnsonii]|nr:helix-turn-helix transcriptional regulator [Acinetobacter johnsonii]
MRPNLNKKSSTNPVRFSVADLIRGTGINKTTLHKLYNGDLTRIDLDTINRICDYLDIQVGDLFVFEKDI